jgi:transcriptional regulator with XRE-family HTH domain
MATLKKSDFRPARSRILLSRGDIVRITRELQGLSQAELSEACGIPQPTVSAIENNRVTLGIERAQRLARVLRVHPAVLLFPQWDVQEESKRAAG